MFGGHLFEAFIAVCQGDDADDVAFPFVEQALGSEDACEHLIPGSFLDIDVHRACDVVIDNEIEAHGPGERPQQHGDIGFVHAHGDLFGGQFFFRLLALLVQGLNFGNLGRGGDNGALLGLGRISPGLFGRHFPLLNKRVLLLLIMCATEKQRQGEDDRYCPMSCTVVFG